MNIFKVIYSYFYYLFTKRSYLLLKDDEKEKIYHKNGKYMIAVRDVEVGKRLYEVVKSLNNSTVTYMPFADFKFTSYGINRNNVVKWFCIEGGITGEWKYLVNLNKLRVIQHFVEFMQAKGFVLDDTRFSNSGCGSVSEFLSFFIQSDEEDKIERSKGCMIQYIHYVFSNGGNLKDFYESFSNNGFSEGYNIPYNSPVARMCYNYFETGATPDSILDTLVVGKFGEYENYSLVAIQDKLESKFEVTEKTDEYTIYGGVFKIYHNISSEYEKALADGRIIYESERATLEPMQAIIVDMDNHIIGYKFAKLDAPNMRTVFNPKSQAEIFNFIIDMISYLEKYNLSRKEVAQTESVDFEIEKCLACKGFSRGKYIFKCNTIKDLFNLAASNWEMLKEQVTVIFFKLLADYMAKKYGELTSKEQFLEKNEVRFLSPVIVSEFVNFVLGNPVDYHVATEEFFKLLENRAISNNSDFCYDARFCYNPTAVHFVFDYEAEKKYNVKLEKGTTEKLPDDRTVVTFKRSRNIQAFVDKEEFIRASAMSALKTEDEYVKLLGVSEIILGTQRLNTDNMYNIIGYVSHPLRGEQLTDAVLLKLNNRDLLNVAAYLFCKFNKYYIPWNNIWMDKDFKFYINYMDEDFRVEKSASGINNASTFVQSVFDYLLSAGYNPNAFVGWSLPNNGGYKVTRQYLVNLAYKFNLYCDEHKIYYDGSTGQCPVCAKTKYLVPLDFEQKFTKVFEDSVGVHYNIDQMYNLKIYKSTYAADVKENVARMVSLRLKNQGATLNFFQDCFLPCKIALDTNNQFVGYIYEAVRFRATNGDTSDVCVDLEDGKRLNNLPRLKSLIRLILQVKEMTNQKLCFMINPFTHVFLNTSHKRQVQILNIEFMVPPLIEHDLMKTKLWTRDYIYKVLESDPTIEFKRSDLPEGLDSILAKLTELSGQMTRKCSIHNMYYKSSYMCCPKCVKPADQPKNLMHASKSQYKAKKPVNEGGEAYIYAHSKGTVAKVFKEGAINKEFKCTVLFKISSKKGLLEKVNQEEHKYKYVIPKEILLDSTTGEMFGYIMDWVENAFPISTLKDKVQIQKLGLSKKDIFEIIITVGEGIEALHKLNIYIGDLNGRNILFDAQKNVYFLDFDGMGVDEIAPEFCTDGYIDPLSKKNQCITMKDDWYSFAVQAFYYLTYTHPFNGIYSVRKKGNDVMLDIPEKMERRISLLGDHGMKAPEIAEPWDWMSAELKYAFLSIFEGDNRESIVPYLQKQYQALSTNVNEQSFNKIYRINPKFIATELEVFYGNVVKVINPYAAIGENENGRYVAVLANINNQTKELHVSFNGSVERIDDILFSEDRKIVFIVHDKVNLTVIDLERDETILSEQISGATNVVVNDRTIYFTGISKENFVIFKRTIQPNGEVVKETIGVGNNRIKWFNVKFNTKFILITQAAQDVDALYCNSQQFCKFTYNSAEIARRACYNVLYDEATKSWLVINNFGRGTTIQMSGEGTEIDISKYVNDVNFENIYFEKGNIYIPSQECMYIFNVNTKAVKKMECHKIMALESKVYDVNSSGFSVITQNVLYEVRKG